MDDNLIKQALNKLDPKSDSHWTEDGLPAIAALQALLNDDTITRKMVNENNQEFKRPDNVIKTGEEASLAAGETPEKVADSKPPVPKGAKKVGVDGDEAKQILKSADEINKEIESRDDYMKNKSVITLAPGVASGSVRSVGEVFNYSGLPGSWFRKATKDEVTAYAEWLSQQ